jgi:inhibitor of KinA sporulation pathway (predicted exonuclease)
MPQVDERLKPITEREKQAQEQAKQQEALRAVETRTKQQIETAKTWANWTDYEGDVLGKLKADSDAARAAGKRPTMTLREAYLEVRAERLSTDHNKVREKVLAEIKQAPKATSVSRQTTDAPRTPGVLSVSDIAARTLERLERGA